MIAMALALKPKLLIADEPTTALDATVQAQLMELLESMQREMGMAMMVITHDLGVIATIADNVLVMYAGRGVERSETRTIFYQPHHPYTRGLLGSVPNATGVHGRLVPIVGQPPSLIRVPTGCAFHPRCPFAMDVCIDKQPELIPVAGGSGHASACWLPPDLVGVGLAMDTARQRYAESHRTERAGRLPGVNAARDGGGPRRGDRERRRAPANRQRRRALPYQQGIFFKKQIGARPCGRRRHPRGDAAARPWDWSVRPIAANRRGPLHHLPLPDHLRPDRVRRRRHQHPVRGTDMRPYRRGMQMIFQDPYGSLNLRRRMGSSSVSRSAIHNISEVPSAKKQVQGLMEVVGLNPKH